MTIKRQGYIGKVSHMHDVVPQCKQDIILGIHLVLG